MKLLIKHDNYWNTATAYVTANKTDVFQHSQRTEVRKDDCFNVETSSVQGVHKYISTH